LHASKKVLTRKFYRHNFFEPDRYGPKKVSGQKFLGNFFFAADPETQPGRAGMRWSGRVHVVKPLFDTPFFWFRIGSAGTFSHETFFGPDHSGAKTFPGRVLWLKKK
jgi:hypothetical protein